MVEVEHANDFQSPTWWAVHSCFLGLHSEDPNFVGGRISILVDLGGGHAISWVLVIGIGVEY